MFDDHACVFYAPQTLAFGFLWSFGCFANLADLRKFYFAG